MGKFSSKKTMGNPARNTARNPERVWIQAAENLGVLARK